MFTSFTVSNEAIDAMINQQFDRATIMRGYEYYQIGRVTHLSIASESEDDIVLTANVMGSQSRKYFIEIDLYSEDEVTINLECTCSCYIGYFCKHIVATLLAYMTQNAKTNIQHAPLHKSETDVAADALTHWLNDLTPITQPNNLLPTKKPSTPHELVYVLQQSSHKNKTLEVNLQLCRLLKKGGYGKPQKYRLTTDSQQAYLQTSDEEILVGLQFLNRSRNSGYHYSETMRLEGAQSSKWLKAMLDTHRCFYGAVGDTHLSIGKPQPLHFHWEMLPNACQALQLSANSQDIELLILDELWYLDKHNKCCGPIQTKIEPATLKSLMQMPPIPPEMTESATERLKAMLPDEQQAFPKILDKPIAKMSVEPIPQMHLNIESIRVKNHQEGYYYRDSERYIEGATMAISFNYDGRIVPFSIHNKSEIITYVQDGTLFSTKRNFEKEKNYLLSLSDYFRLEPLNTDMPANQPNKLLITSLQNEDEYLQLVLYTIPQLEAQGWHVFRDHEAFMTVVYEEDVSWYSELDETSEYDYFGFKMGILVDGERINMLPVIAQILKATPPEQLKTIKDDEIVPLPLPNGKILSVPYERIKPMLTILIELYDAELSPQDAIRLSKHQSALLYEIQRAFGASKLRWFGGEKLRQLGKKLSEFKSIKAVSTPKTFKATLRNYQQEGLNWLQFLREYQMGGILADDMGLGKTVQTLAHLSVEKNRRRLKKPCLIIAPTSLMVNWRQETEKFAPNLKTLVFHGDNRHAYTDSVAEHDIVLTTYPLLVRDKQLWLEQEFYYLILDEAQFIKNHKAKSTLIVQQLKAEHRLCVTGTPMENHLGELWSLFNFLMPGFLGDSTQFKKLFRTPIEKHQDDARRKSLALRIKPFMLRRQKKEVLTELPDKTEIIRKFELQGPERDLYESIRLSMEKKVRDAIAQNGLSRSHIIILDALLKLRQICCHSRLLKLTSAKKAHKHSSKLVLLKEMLPKMVEEGRKILLFSQFTTMLEIIEEMLKQENLTYVKLTGSTKHRAKPIETFQAGKVPIFLISLKAGGTGLNLTQADTVIHYDPWWNPAVEDQATDRAHRMGQKKSLFVYKLIGEGTVEETIQQMQQKKRGLMEDLFSEQQKGKLKLSADDLNNLFRPLG